jgi:hypothetical protein
MIGGSWAGSKEVCNGLRLDCQGPVKTLQTGLQV